MQKYLNLSYALQNVKRTLEQIIIDELPKVGLKKKELAKEINLSGSHFSNISNGKASTRKSGYRPDPETVNKIALKLNVSVEEILEGQGYNLTKTPSELVSFIEKYKELPEASKTKVLGILNMLTELIFQNLDQEESGEQIGKTKINKQEVNIRIIDPSEELPLIKE